MTDGGRKTRGGGKPVGNVLMQGVVTRPVLVDRKRDPEDPAVRDFVAARSGSAPEARVLERVRSPEVLDEAYRFAQERGDMARRSLASLPDTVERRSLEGLIDYVIARDQ